MEQNNTGVEYMNEYNRGGVAKATRQQRASNIHHKLGAPLFFKTSSAPLTRHTNDGLT
jgi:hypothetical protein